MPNAADLTTLADLKNFISPSLGASTASDASLQKIITAVSKGIERYLSRTIANGQFSEVRNGNGVRSMRTLVYPILSVTSAVISCQGSGTTITPTNSGLAQSLTFDKWFIYLNEGIFPDGKQNVTLNYSGGYITPGQLQLLALSGWAANTTTAQNAQIAVAGFLYQALNSGTTGTSAPVWSTATNSIVNDNGLMWICLGAVPSLPQNASLAPDDLTLACMQQSALLFRNRTRIGDTSSGEGPDRINYFLKDAHPSTIAMLKPHREVYPIDGMGVN